MTSEAEIRRWLAEPRVRGFMLAALWAGLALHGLGGVSIVGDDESREVGIVQDILAGHWLWPMFNAELIPDKPLLSHWLSALSCAIFGFSEAAVRLPSVLAAAGTIWWTVEFGSSLLGPRAGLAAGIVLATCRGFFAHARVARPDTLLVLLLALALGYTWRWWEDRSRRHATAALALLGAGVLAKGPVAPALYVMTVGLFLLWQRDLRRILDLPTLAGAAALLVLGLAWYAIGWAGWGAEFTREHLIGRYARNLLGGLTSGGAYSTKPWYHHVFFYPQHLPGVIWPWSPFAAVGLWRLWRHGGLRDPRARFLLCWVIAPVVVFTPAEWKLRYYLLPSLPPLALLTGPFLAELVDAPFLPFRITRGSVITGAGIALVACAAGLLYLQRPDLLSESDQLTRDALLAGLGGEWEVATLIGLAAGIVAVAIACRAWGGLVVLVGVAAALWIAAGEPRLDAATSSRDSLAAFGREAAARFPADRPLAFYGADVRPVVVYVGRPIPSLERHPGRITPGSGVIAFKPAYRALAKAGYLGPPLAKGTGRVGNVDRALLVLAEGVTPPQVDDPPGTR